MDQPEQKFVTEVAQVSEAIDAELSDPELLKWQQEYWIDYNAVGGLIIDENGEFKKSPRNPKRSYGIEDLANDLGVDKRTLYRWRDTIPNFWKRVAERRRKIAGETRTAQVWNGIFLKARSGDVRAAMLWLANNDQDNFVMPQQSVKHEAGNSWAALLGQRRIKSEKTGILEGEIVDATPNQPGTI